MVNIEKGPMQRADREIKEMDGILEVIEECKVMRIAMHQKDEIYIVPLNFAYLYKEGKLIFYYHSSLKGLKIDLLKENPKVGFEMDCQHNLIEGKVACQYSFQFASVVGQGEASIVTDPKEKIRAMTLLMKQQTGKDFEFNERLVSIIHIIKVEVTAFRGKRRV